MKDRNNRKTIIKNREGFTLMEVIVVIAIVAILAAVAIPRINVFISDADGDEDMRLAEQLFLATEFAVQEYASYAEAAESYDVIWETTGGEGNSKLIVSNDGVDLTAEGVTSPDEIAIRNIIAIQMGWADELGDYTSDEVDDAKSETGTTSPFQFKHYTETGENKVNSIKSSGWVNTLRVGSPTL